MNRKTVFLLLLLFITPTFAKVNVPVPSLSPILQKTLPAIVNITTHKTLEQLKVETTKNGHTNPVSLASGVIVDAEKGYILTNEHVIHSAEKINVTLKDGRRLPAKLIGGDSQSDVALIQIKPIELTEITLGDSGELHVGDFVIAIGNPYGLNQSVTSGIVSALGRTDLRIEGYEDFIQTDANINPGNSGGALINLKGELVGINTAILAPFGNHTGIGFAIPINMAENVMMQLIKFGHVRRGLLGVLAQTLTPELAESFKVPHQTGALVSQIVPDSLAEKSGINVGDIITQVNTHNVTSASSLRNMIGLVTIGESIYMTLIREGKPQKIKLKMPDPKKNITRAKKIHPNLSGALLGNFNQVLGTHGTTQGVVILSLTQSSPAYAKGLRLHDVIVEANHKKITTLADLSPIKKNQSLILRVLRNDGAVYVVL